MKKLFLKLKKFEFNFPSGLKKLKLDLNLVLGLRFLVGVPFDVKEDGALKSEKSRSESFEATAPAHVHSTIQEEMRHELFFSLREKSGLCQV